MKFRTEDKPAPGELIRVQGFLNTRSDELSIEDLPDPGTAESWLRQADVWTSDRTLSPKDLKRLQEFREVLRSYVLRPSATGSVAALNQYAQRVKLEIAVSTDGFVQTKVGNAGVDEVIGHLLRAIHESVQQGTWSRLKCCELATCGWSFYDSTRNRSGRWCSMQSCGSRHKARQYLKRKAETKQTDH